MLDQSRIDELRRRIDLDPTSIAFAELAEEYRKAGRPSDAVALCRTGLARHPAYLSARVTLGRALAALGDLRSAQAELEQVLRVTPASLPALRALADVFEQRGEPERARTLLEQASGQISESPAPALPAQYAEPVETRPEPEAEEPLEVIEHVGSTAAAEPVELELAAEAEPASEPVESARSVTADEPTPDAGASETRSPQLLALEGFLARIEAANRRRESGDPIAGA